MFPLRLSFFARQKRTPGGSLGRRSEGNVRHAHGRQSTGLLPDPQWWEFLARRHGGLSVCSRDHAAAHRKRSRIWSAAPQPEFIGYLSRKSANGRLVEAPKGRKRVGGGVSSRIGYFITRSPVRGERPCVSKVICRPSRALHCVSIHPRAHARGYFLAALRALASPLMPFRDRYYLGALRAYLWCRTSSPPLRSPGDDPPISERAPKPCQAIATMGSGTHSDVRMRDVASPCRSVLFKVSSIL
jgi:hypothetical protein